MPDKIILKKGEVLAFKTDTVWGFGAHPEDCDAVQNIYKIKNRDIKKPLILMSYNLEPLKKYIDFIPDYAEKLIEKYLPGGLTLIFKKTKLVSDLITPFDTVGIRIPDSIDFMELTKKIDGGVLATTSCNISSEPPVKNYTEAKNKFNNLATVIEPVIMPEKETENVPSTVIMCNNDDYKILRQGVIKL